MSHGDFAGVHRPTWGIHAPFSGAERMPPKNCKEQPCPASHRDFKSDFTRSISTGCRGSPPGLKAVPTMKPSAWGRNAPLIGGNAAADKDGKFARADEGGGLGRFGHEPGQCPCQCPTRSRSGRRPARAGACRLLHRPARGQRTGERSVSRLCQPVSSHRRRAWRGCAAGRGRLLRSRPGRPPAPSRGHSRG